MAVLFAGHANDGFLIQRELESPFSKISRLPTHVQNDATLSECHLLHYGSRQTEKPCDHILRLRIFISRSVVCMYIHDQPILYYIDIMRRPCVDPAKTSC